VNKIFYRRNNVFVCNHASMLFGAVFTTERNKYEWNFCGSTEVIRNRGSNASNFVDFEKELGKKCIIPIIFE